MHKIFQDDIPVGTAEVIRNGLYYRIKCECMPIGSGMHRIILSDSHTVIDLGICVPNGMNYTLNTSVSAKLLSTEKLYFTLQEHKGSKRKLIVPLASGKEFQFLDKLDNAVLQRIGDTQCVIIYLTQDQLDNGRNRGLQNISV